MSLSPQGLRERPVDRGVAPASGARLVRARLREVLAPGFSGSRADLEVAIGRRLELALVLVILAARAVHLAQAAVSLALAQDAYTRPWLADLTGAACLVESVALAAGLLRRGCITFRLMLVDAAFGVAALAALSAATTSAPGRGAALNWMLQYTVATATGLGLVAQGRLLAAGGEAPRRSRPWGAALVALALMTAYTTSVLVPHAVPGEDRGAVLQDAVNYPVFFLAALLAGIALRRLLVTLGRRNTAVTTAAAAVAHEAQWRAVAVDVFGPVLRLLDEVAAADGTPPPGMHEEAGRLIELIESVRPAGR